MVEYFGLDKDLLKNLLKKVNMENNLQDYINEQKTYGLKFNFDNNKNIECINILFDNDKNLEINQKENFEDILSICGLDNCIPASHNIYISQNIDKKNKLVNWEQLNRILKSISQLTEEKCGKPIQDITLTECTSDDIKSDGLKYATIIYGSNKDSSSCYIYLDYRQLLNLVDVINNKPYLSEQDFSKLVEDVIWNKNLCDDIPLLKRNYLKHNLITAFSNGIVLSDNIYDINNQDIKTKIKNSNDYNLIEYCKNLYNKLNKDETNVTFNEEEIER